MNGSAREWGGAAGSAHRCVDWGLGEALGTGVESQLKTLGGQMLASSRREHSRGHSGAGALGLSGVMDQMHHYCPTPVLLRATSFFGAISPYFMPDFH